MNSENNSNPQMKIEIPGLTIEANQQSFIPNWFQLQFGDLLNEIIKMHFSEAIEIKKEEADKNNKNESQEDSQEYVSWNEDSELQLFKITGFIKYEEKSKVSVQILIGKGDSIKFSRNYTDEVDGIINVLPEIIENIQDFIKRNASSEFDIAAEVNYKQCIKEVISLLQEHTDDDSIEKHFITGMFLAKAGEEEKSLENLDYVIKNSANPEMVQDCYKLVLSVKAKKSMKDLDSAQNEVYNGDPAKAVSLIESLIQITPKYIHLHYLLGMALKKSGQREKSIQAFKNALEIDSEHVPSCRELAEELVSMDKNGEAEEVYRKIMQLGQANATDYYNLGMCLKRLGRVKELDEVIEKIKELDTDGKLDSYIFNLFDMGSNFLKEDTEPEKKKSLLGRLFGK
ncbi:MAG: tetratricopeptide repeat protein [Deltaproteobacteria bacterium]